MENVNNFLKKVREFEEITNRQITDMWRIKDMAFQPLKVQLDIQEYIPGLFDILRINERLPITKILSVFCYLNIETINLTHEIETKYFDPLVFFGENGSLFADSRPEHERAGEEEIQMSRCLPVLSEFFDTMSKVVRLSKNMLLQMNGLFNSKDPVYKESFKKICYWTIFDNLGQILTYLYVVDLIIKDNVSFEDYWAQYNQMFQKVKSNMDAYTIEKTMLRKVQKHVEKLYANILSGKLYQQYFEVLKADIRNDLGETLFKNKTFAEMYVEYIKFKVDRVSAQLDSPG